MAKSYRDADLRGKDFSGASLRGADFGNARTGLGARTTIAIAVLSVVLAIGIGLLSAWYVDHLRGLVGSAEPRLRYAAGAIIGVFAAFCFVLFRHGVARALKRVVL